MADMLTLQTICQLGLDTFSVSSVKRANLEEGQVMGGAGGQEGR